MLAGCVRMSFCLLHIFVRLTVGLPLSSLPQLSLYCKNKSLSAIHCPPLPLRYASRCAPPPPIALNVSICADTWAFSLHSNSGPIWAYIALHNQQGYDNDDSLTPSAQAIVLLNHNSISQQWWFEIWKLNLRSGCTAWVLNCGLCAGSWESSRSGNEMSCANFSCLPQKGEGDRDLWMLGGGTSLGKEIC